MTTLRLRAFVATLASLALLATLTAAPAAARTVDVSDDQGLQPAASGLITGRIFIEPTGGGTPVAANAGYVRLYEVFTCCDATAATILTSTGNFSFPGQPAGFYFVEFVSLDSRALPVREWYDNRRKRLYLAATVSLVDGVPFSFGNVTLEERVIETDRVFGANRFETAAKVNAQVGQFADGWDQDVVIVNGTNFPDALSAGTLASSESAALLMVTRDAIPADTIAELNRIDPLTVTIVGGPGVVSPAVEAQLATFVGGSANVRRISGADRYSTSREAVETLFVDDIVTELFIATGRNYPDALAAVPAAANRFGAVLLVDGARGTLDAASAELIDRLGVPVTIVGGTGVVSAGIEADIAALVPEVLRISGANRFATAIGIAVEFFPIADSAFIATGSGFADALAIGPIAGRLHSPVYLSSSNCVPEEVLTDLIFGLFSEVTLVGGPGVLSARVENLIPCS